MRHISLLLLVCCSVAEGASLVNWHADYSPCTRHSELLKRGHMNLGVRVATANPALAEQFRRALDSWARVLDLDWHDDNTDGCSIQVVDGGRELFEPSTIAARSQLPDRLDFQGWIAFNPAQEMSDAELYRISLHELGHLMGLQHNSDVMSVMYGFALDGQKWLDTADLAALAAHHKLRVAILDRPVKLTGPPPASSPGQ
jgi:hypothetical protein